MDKESVKSVGISEILNSIPKINRKKQTTTR